MNYEDETLVVMICVPRIWSYALHNASPNEFDDVANNPVVYQLLTLFAIWRRGIHQRVWQANFN